MAPHQQDPNQRSSASGDDTRDIARDYALFDTEMVAYRAADHRAKERQEWTPKRLAEVPRAYALTKRTPVARHVARVIGVVGGLQIAVAIQDTWWFWPVQAVCLSILGRTVWVNRRAVKRWFLNRLDEFLDKY
jgi:hypothetical protein